MTNAKLALVLVLVAAASAQQFTDTAAGQNSGRTNDPAAVELFRDRGLGLFIHWGVDGPLGGVISHSLVGASPDYVERFFRLLPGYFNPVRYHPEEWAALAKLAGLSGSARIPQDSSTISSAPPIAVLTTGRPAQSASTNAIPNGSGA